MNLIEKYVIIIISTIAIKIFKWASRPKILKMEELFFVISPAALKVLTFDTSCLQSYFISKKIITGKKKQKKEIQQIILLPEQFSHSTGATLVVSPKQVLWLIQQRRKKMTWHHRFSHLKGHITHSRCPFLCNSSLQGYCICSWWHSDIKTCLSFRWLQIHDKTLSYRKTIKNSNRLWCIYILLLL